MQSRLMPSRHVKGEKKEGKPLETVSLQNILND